MGRGGFPPSETGSFSAHHTAQWVGLLFRCQVYSEDHQYAFFLLDSLIELKWHLEHPN
jgi:hypothetical protein